MEENDNGNDGSLRKDKSSPEKGKAADNEAKPKRHRTMFTKEQSRLLEEAFQVCKKLNRKRCEELSNRTKIEKTASIYTWFNNRRVKERNQKEIKNEPSEGNTTSPEKKPTVTGNEVFCDEIIQDTTIIRQVDSKENTASPREKKSPLRSISKESKNPLCSKETKTSQHKKLNVLKFTRPRGPRRKNRTPPRMLPPPKVPGSPHRGPPDLTLPFSEIKFMLTCSICKNYLYNATTLTECLHSFCKSCLMIYVTKNLHCPTCKLLIHPSNPYLNIRIDNTVQDIVYKILPEIEKEEKRKEEEFYVSRGLPYPPTSAVYVPTPPLVEPTESDEESEGSGDTDDDSYLEDIIPPNWTSVLLQYAGASDELGRFEPLEKNFLRVSSEVTIGQIRMLLKIKLLLLSRTDIELHMFVDTTLVHDSLSLNEIKKLFFTEDKDELLILQYGIVSAKRNLCDEFSKSNPEDFTDEFDRKENTDNNYIYKEDIDSCGYDFLTKSVEPDVDFPVVKREYIKQEIDDIEYGDTV